jgi:hypothetical protein
MTSTTHAPLPDLRLATTGLRVSGVIGGIGLVFLIAMYTAFAAGARGAGMTLGWISDVAGVVTLPLALPGMVIFSVRLRPDTGRLGGPLLVLGVGSSAAVSILQLMLVTGVLSFEQEIGPVTIAYLCLGAWFIVTGRLAQRSGILAGGLRLGAFAAVYAGYPVWAFRLARTLDLEPGRLPGSASA